MAFDFTEKEKGDWKGIPWKIIGLKNKAYLCIYEIGDQPLNTEGIRLNHFGFHVSDFDTLLAKLQSNNIKINYEGIVQNEKSRSIYIEDPNGFEIELSEAFGGGLE